MAEDSISLRDYIDKRFEDKEKADNQRFLSQEAALNKAEQTRDTAINKAELSIEKKSDAVYVKLTDLQKALTEVMLRPEIEGRFKAQGEKLDRIEKTQTEMVGRGSGANDLWKILLGALGGASIIYSFIR